MAFGTQPHILPSPYSTAFVTGFADDTDALSLEEPEEKNPYSHTRIKVRAGVLKREVVLGLQNESLADENAFLRKRVQKMKDVIANSKLETAELSEKFGELAKSWKEMMRQIKAEHEENRTEYEKRIEALEKMNERLMKENAEMKKVIANFEKLQSELKETNEKLVRDNEETKKIIAGLKEKQAMSEKERLKLTVAQIVFKLELLVSEYVFPGTNRASRRARYNLKLKSLRSKVEKLEDENMQNEAMLRLNDLDAEMFENWFLDMVDDLKQRWLDAAHPKLGSYDEIEAIINDEFAIDEDDEREDILKALKYLQIMYQKLNRHFGE